MPAQVLSIRTPLPPNQSASASLPLNTQGPIQKMEPLTLLQVTIVPSQSGVGIITKTSMWMDTAQYELPFKESHM